MRMSLSCSDRTPALNGALGLILAACLAGCASKNPLIDAPVAASTTASSPASAGGAEAGASTAASTQAERAGTQTTGPTGVRRFLGIFAPYRVDVQQGNFISREMVDQLKEGMQRPEGVTPEQVRFVLGTPLLNDIFHADRWDYAFRLQRRNGEVIASRVTVFFKDNRVARIDSGILPTEKEYLAFLAGAAPGSTPGSTPGSK
jgi:outer membrane protein assembly factor BamE